MLQLYKNQVVTTAAKKQVEIRQLELDWYSTNYWTLSQQGALLAGFTFGQITTPLPRETPYLLECAYLLLTTLSMGMQLCVVVTTTFCCMWGPGLALRGPHGSQSVHLAVDHLRAEQSHVFGFFVAGLLTFYLSNLLLLWCYFEQWVAMVSCLILSVFFFLIIYYTCLLTYQLRVTDETAVFGKVEALKAYENIGDLDAQYASTNVMGGEYGEASAPFSFAASSNSNLYYPRCVHSSELPSRGTIISAAPTGGCLPDISSHVAVNEEIGGGTGGPGRPCIYHSPSSAAHPTITSLFCPPAFEDQVSLEINSGREVAGANAQRHQCRDEVCTLPEGNDTRGVISYATPQGFWQTLLDVFS